MCCLLRARRFRWNINTEQLFTPMWPSFEPAYSLAEDLDVPIGVHTGLGLPDAAYWGIPAWRASNNNPLLLEDVLVKYPKLRLYVVRAQGILCDLQKLIIYSIFSLISSCTRLEETEPVRAKYNWGRNHDEHDRQDQPAPAAHARAAFIAKALLQPVKELVQQK